MFVLYGLVMNKRFSQDIDWSKKKVESSLNLPVTLVFWIFDTLPALTALLTRLLLLLLLAVVIDELIPLSRTWFKLSALRAEVTQGVTIGTSWTMKQKNAKIFMNVSRTWFKSITNWFNSTTTCHFYINNI